MGLQIQPPPSNAPVGLLGRSKDFEYLLWLVKIFEDIYFVFYMILSDNMEQKQRKLCLHSLLTTLLCENLKALTRRTVLLASFIP